MITIHHLENSRSLRVLWLLEELEVDYQIKHYARHKKTMLAPAELKAIHPLGKSPVIVDESQDIPPVVAETGAIFDYITEHYANGRLVPEAGSQNYLDYRYWLHYAEGSMMPLLVMKLIFSRLSKSPMPLPLRPVGHLIGTGVIRQFLAPQVTACLDFMHTRLEQSDWFAGDQFSAADVMLSFPLQAVSAKASLHQYPKLGQFLENIQTRPAYQRALEQGGPLNLSL